MEKQPVRSPAVAGRFYPGDPDALRKAVTDYLGKTEAARPARVVVAPHAGYIYSGAIAGETYAKVRVPSRVIVLCPNHTGLGVRRSVWAAGAWKLPGGAVPIDAELAEACRRHADLTVDEDAHVAEHAIEVHLPFLRAKRPDVSVVPICLGPLSEPEVEAVGEGLARVVSDVAGEEPLIVASTDMSHYISAGEADRLDHRALERVLALDGLGLYRVVTDQRISMCGYVPTAAALIAAVRLGATEATLVRYGHSGQTSGDFDRVVGYAGVVVR